MAHSMRRVTKAISWYRTTTQLSKKDKKKEERREGGNCKRIAGSRLSEPLQQFNPTERFFHLESNVEMQNQNIAPSQSPTTLDSKLKYVRHQIGLAQAEEFELAFHFDNKHTIPNKSLRQL